MQFVSLSLFFVVPVLGAYIFSFFELEKGVGVEAGERGVEKSEDTTNGAVLLLLKRCHQET